MNDAERDALTEELGVLVNKPDLSPDEIARLHHVIDLLDPPATSPPPASVDALLGMVIE